MVKTKIDWWGGTREGEQTRKNPHPIMSFSNVQISEVFKLKHPYLLRVQVGQV
jgi:hypothetical protein